MTKAWRIVLWAVLALIAWLCRKQKHPVVWALICGAFGLGFGLLCAPVYIFSGGVEFALSWWISGIPYDLLHCGGNFAMALVLWKPLHQLLQKLKNRMTH